MTINLTGAIRYDTRGLPEGYDPHKFYEYRYETMVKDATGLESFLHKYIPYSLLKSFAIAIDPTYPFKVAPHAITKANRTKYRQTASVLQKRFSVQGRNRQTWAPIPNFNGVSNCWSPYLVYNTLPPSDVTLSQTAQEPLPDYLKDTTSRTRLFGSELGELELFKSWINSPPRSVSTGSTDRAIYHPNPYPPNDPCIWSAHGAPYYQDGGYDYKWIRFYPTGSTLFLSTYNALKVQEIAYNKALAQKYAIPMLKGWSPMNRDYTLFRNLAELRDIPRSILSLRETLGNLRTLYASLSTSPSLRKIVFDLKKTSKDIPNEYLSFHFGWKQTYRDIMDLLEAPSKIAKRYNLLIKRNGLPTTYRSKRNIPSAVADVSGFSYTTSGFESFKSLKHRLERESELRLVINATFDFPPVNTVSFRLNDYLDRLGVIPRVTDVYNLVPWTWLVDWFTGFGNYVELIDNMNRDNGLINWGMLTVVTNGKLISNYESESTFVDNVFDHPVGGGTIGSSTTRRVANLHESVLHFTCQTRNDVATILDVKTTSVPSSLTAYQKSIIGALLAQRAEVSGPGTFRPRS